MPSKQEIAEGNRNAKLLAQEYGIELEDTVYYLPAEKLKTLEKPKNDEYVTFERAVINW